MACVRLQIISEIVQGHTWIELASKGFTIDAAAIAVTDEIIKLANKKLQENIGQSS